MTAIYKKELKSYFINPLGYVFVTVYLAASALIFCFTTLKSKSYDTSSFFQIMIFAYIVLIPLLTMKLFSEERKMRTEQLLLIVCDHNAQKILFAHAAAPFPFS